MLSAGAQVFPRYTHHPLTSDDLFATEPRKLIPKSSTPGEERYERCDNITDFALAGVPETLWRRQHHERRHLLTTSTACCTSRITARRFANNLRRELPRIPMAPDFGAFAEAGRRLAKPCTWILRASMAMWMNTRWNMTIRGEAIWPGGWNARN